MTSFLFVGGRVVDPRERALRDGIEVLVEDGRIKEVSDAPIRASAAAKIDLAGRPLMPGLIECRAPALAGPVALRANAMAPPSLTAARAVRIMGAMLSRGFTAVRDCCGADHGLALAVEEGLIAGPRLVISGKGLSQTGGHGDMRHR